ncbi:MAG TPA: polysaccharide biosynthesis protein, partial [Rhodobacterales bacterium]|nr:polysaccharide biosynthesis protein [Rhodobacterales bacterium]
AIVGMVVAAWATRSVWALVIGGLLDPFLRVLLSNLFITGPGNRLRWDRSAVRDLLGFGRWITLSTAFTFLVMQGDKLVLGKVLSLDALGLYNIGYYLASFPVVVAGSLVHRVLIPVYRDAHPASSEQNARFLRRIRGLMSAGMSVSLLLLALFGPGLVGLLYDPRYAASGTILTLVALALVPQVVGVSYDRAALAAGNSKGFFYLSGFRALVQFGLVLAGAAEFGLVGAIGGLALSGLIVHPAIVLLARRHRVWDAGHDLAAFSLGLGAAGVVFWLHWGDIQSLAASFAG